MRKLALTAAVTAALLVPASASASLPIPLPDVASPTGTEALTANIDRISSLPIPLPGPSRARLQAILVLGAKVDDGIIIIDPGE